MKAKRYLVFYGSVYYPDQGLGDMITTTDSVEDGKDCIVSHILTKRTEYDAEYSNQEFIEGETNLMWAQIWDIQDITKPVFEIEEAAQFVELYEEIKP